MDGNVGATLGVIGALAVLGDRFDVQLAIEITGLTPVDFLTGPNAQPRRPGCPPGSRAHQEFALRTRRVEVLVETRGFDSLSEERGQPETRNIVARRHRLALPPQSIQPEQSSCRPQGIDRLAALRTTRMASKGNQGNPGGGQNSQSGTLSDSGFGGMDDKQQREAARKGGETSTADQDRDQ
jgi:hypothetical protein